MGSSLLWGLLAGGLGILFFQRFGGNLGSLLSNKKVQDALNEFTKDEVVNKGKLELEETKREEIKKDVENEKNTSDSNLIDFFTKRK